VARPKRASFTPQLADHRRRRGLTQEQVAERIGLSVEMIRRHERGLAYPGMEFRHKYVLLYGASESDLGLVVSATSLHQPAAPGPGHAPALPIAFNDSDQLGVDALVAIDTYIRQVVALDNQFGGTELATLAARFFRSLHRQIGAGRYEPAIRSDLIAAAGELAEVVGWLAYDADRQDLVRRMNQESLYFTRLAGDRAVELLTLQNASMHAGFLGKPFEALDIADSVLSGKYRLTPRVRCLFLLRKARARAQGGDGASLRLLGEARSHYQDGPRCDDPPWAWWIDEREISWHEAMCRADLGDHVGALPLFERSVEATPAGETRSQFLHRAHLLEAQVIARSWDGAGTTIAQLEPLALQVSSRRTRRIISRALNIVRTTQGGTLANSVKDSANQLADVLADDADV
jgi:transcriptional regulator with XRE-family HTH domain